MVKIKLYLCLKFYKEQKTQLWDVNSYNVWTRIFPQCRWFSLIIEMKYYNQRNWLFKIVTAVFLTSMIVIVSSGS